MAGAQGLPNRAISQHSLSYCSSIKYAQNSLWICFKRKYSAFVARRARIGRKGGQHQENWANASEPARWKDKQEKE
jgi:hypothetical protein